VALPMPDEAPVMKIVLICDQFLSRIFGLKPL